MFGVFGGFSEGGFGGLGLGGSRVRCFLKFPKRLLMMASCEWVRLLMGSGKRD